jgi:hypothetical protein
MERSEKNKEGNTLMYVIDLLAVLERDQQNTNAMLTYVYKESRVCYQNVLRCSWFCASAPIKLFNMSCDFGVDHARHQ